MSDSLNTMLLTEKSISSEQPRGLYLLFFTELWERFGFYTLQTIMTLYMVHGLGWSDEVANNLYAAANALLYVTPAVGGYLAGRYLGFQRSVMLGGILLVFAYLIAALPTKQWFFLGLSLLICGNGFFKPNVSSLVGMLYEKNNDPRRDGGFTLFYMGINIGALIPPVIAGYLVAHYGWHSGFLLAAFGMFLGQIIFQLGRKILQGKGAYSTYYFMSTHRHSPSWRFKILLTIGIIVFIGICQIAFSYPELTDRFIEAAMVIILGVVLTFLVREPKVSRQKMLACLVLMIISIGFWSLYNQTFTSLMLFADRNMEHRFLGFHLDAEATQFFNSFFIITLSPLLSRLWFSLNQNQTNPSIPLKFLGGVLFIGLGCLFLGLGTRFFGHEGLTSPWWLVGSYFLQTVGELLLSPIGLAMVTVLSPRHLVGMMMGVWFFSQAVSFTLGGALANIAAVPANMSAVQSLPIYSHAFMIYGTIGVSMSLLCLLLVPWLNKLIRSET